MSKLTEKVKNLKFQKEETQLPSFSFKEDGESFVGRFIERWEEGSSPNGLLGLVFEEFETGKKFLIPKYASLDAFISSQEEKEIDFKKRVYKITRKETKGEGEKKVTVLEFESAEA